MRTLGNILWWFPCFGFINAIFCFLLGGILIATGIGAPLGCGVIQLGKFYFAPFSRAMVTEKALKQNLQHSGVWNALSTFVFIIYIPFGLLICAISIIQIIALCVTIVFIPLAVVLAKSLPTFLNPIGKVCVSTGIRDIIENQAAQKALDSYQKG